MQDNPRTRRQEGALWRLERNLDQLKKAVAKQNGGATDYQTQDMQRMERDIRILKGKLE